MFQHKSIFTESAYIAEELLQSSKYTDLDRKCFVIIQTVKDGDFEISEALELYGVSKTEFDHFVARSIFEELQLFLSHDHSQKFRMLSVLEIIKEIYKKFFATIDDKSDEVLNHMDKLSKSIYDDEEVL